MKWSKSSSNFRYFLYISIACISFFDCIWIDIQRQTFFSYSRNYKGWLFGTPLIRPNHTGLNDIFDFVGWIIIKIRTYEHWTVYNISFKIMKKSLYLFPKEPVILVTSLQVFVVSSSHDAGINQVFSWTTNITLTIHKIICVCSEYFSFEYIPLNWGK